MKAPETIKPVYLSRKAAAVYTSLSERSLDRIMSGGEMPYYRTGTGRGRVLIRVEDLEAYLAERRMAV